MSKLKLTITMSIDGYVAGPDQSPEQPLGAGGENLHDWLYPIKAFRESHGHEGGEVNASTPFAEGILAGAGATIMGRNMFGGGPGPWAGILERLVGGRPAVPPSRLRPHAPSARAGRRWTAGRRSTSSRTGSSRRSIRRGRQPGTRTCLSEAARPSRSISLAAGLLDELVVSVVPRLLGGGARLFENLGDARLEQVESVEAPGVTHIRYVRA